MAQFGDMSSSKLTAPAPTTPTHQGSLDPDRFTITMFLLIIATGASEIFRVPGANEIFL
jgi:hypothetical protein